MKGSGRLVADELHHPAPEHRRGVGDARCEDHDDERDLRAKRGDREHRDDMSTPMSTMTSGRNEMSRSSRCCESAMASIRSVSVGRNVPGMRASAVTYPRAIWHERV
jgi:hypothetical protein